MVHSRAFIRRLLAAALVVAVLLPGVAAAQSAPRKFGRGLAGMTTGFLEVPGNVVATTRSRGAGWGFTLGFVQGLGKLVVRELVGVYEFVTAPFPLPRGYQPIIEPEFPWGYFEGTQRCPPSSSLSSGSASSRSSSRAPWWACVCCSCGGARASCRSC